MVKTAVSVIIPAYNHELYVQHTIKSIIAQSFRDIELIVIDDGSKDNSLKIMQEFHNKMPNVVIHNQVNMGVSVARNNGLKLVRGKYVCFVDSDDILPLDSTKIMLSLADKHGADMVYGKFTKTGKEPMDISAELVSGEIDYQYHHKVS